MSSTHVPDTCLEPKQLGVEPPAKGASSGARVGDRYSTRRERSEYARAAPRENCPVPTMPVPDAEVLRVRYDTESLIAVSDVGEVLSALGRGFERYTRRTAARRGLALAVQRVEVGSLVADLVVVGTGTAIAVAQHPEALYGFVGFIGDLLAIAQGLKPGKNKQADARLIEALSKPVADGNAQQVNIFVVGDGNAVTIDKGAVELVRAARHEAHEALSAGQAGAASDFEDDPVLTLAPPRLLTLTGKHGTAIDVKGQWYVRLEGEGGVLNPLGLAPGVHVRDDQSYSFDGEWEGRRYRIRAAHPIGPA